MAIRIRMATSPDDVAAIAAVGAAAFTPASDPITRGLFPPRLQPTGELDRADAVRWRMQRKTAQLANAHTTVMVAVADADPAGSPDTTTAAGERIVGFSVWTAPHLPGDESKRPEPPDFLDKEALKQVVAELHDGARRVFGGEAHDIWYLDFLGTDPTYRRRGVGKMLVEWGMRKAAEEDADCYLVATPMGKMLYSALGFEDVGTLDLCGAPHAQMIIKNDPIRWKR